MKLYMLLGMISTSNLLHSADSKKVPLLDTSHETSYAIKTPIKQKQFRIPNATTIDYSTWDLHSTTRQYGVTINEWHLKVGPKKIPVQKNCLLHVSAFLCCFQHIIDEHEKSIKEYKDYHEYSWDEATGTMQRFYPYR